MAPPPAAAGYAGPGPVNGELPLSAPSSEKGGRKVATRGAPEWSAGSADQGGEALPAGQHLVDEAVLEGLLGGQDLVAVDVLVPLLDRAVRVLREGLLEPLA